MGLSRKLLGRGEDVVLHLRTHGKALVMPLLVLVLLAALLGVGLTLMPAAAQPFGSWAVVGVFALLIARFVAWPLLGWMTTTYTLTTRRIITRRGVFTKTGHDLPLGRINEVSYTRDLLDRVLGCGTLVITTASETGRVVLPDVPDVERVHVTMTELLFALDEDPRPQREIEEQW